VYEAERQFAAGVYAPGSNGSTTEGGFKDSRGVVCCCCNRIGDRGGDFGNRGSDCSIHYEGSNGRNLANSIRGCLKARPAATSVGGASFYETDP
jgi:hypothetical protein